MELHELKNTWTVLNEQLKKNEILNKQIIQEVLQKKSNKSLNRLINADFFGLIVWIISIPVAIFGCNLPRFDNYLFPKFFFAFILLLALIGLVFYSYKLKFLMKIDFSKSVKNNMFCLNKYIIMIKQEKLSMIVIAPAFAILGALCYYEFQASISYWMLLIVSVIVTVLLSFWMFKRLYDTNICSIKRSLEELEELKD